jgi:chromosome partitioning protein
VLNADARWRSTKEYGRHLAAMAAEQRLALFDTVIPRHQPVTEHARYGLPTAWLRPASTVAVAYRRLAEEVMDRLVALEDRRAAGDRPAAGLAAPPLR